MGMGVPTKGGSGAIAEINVTPLVDVMLVLLIIFMITATLMKVEDDSQRLVEMTLPVTRDNQVVAPTDTDKIILNIDANLRVYIGEELITDCSGAMQSTVVTRFEPCFEEIQAKLGQNARLQEQNEIFILADTNIPYGFVVGTLARIREAGVDRVGMVTNPEYILNQPSDGPG
ncbi:MAG: biopolymer transporter ExbD [Myxococcales bacterium]|nr:biopolymer transporter ExbD [Myxococcales bacterium]